METHEVLIGVTAGALAGFLIELGRIWWMAKTMESG